MEVLTNITEYLLNIYIIYLVLSKSNLRIKSMITINKKYMHKF